MHNQRRRRLTSKYSLPLAITATTALGAALLGTAAASGAVSPLSQASGGSPFAPGCNGAAQRGTINVGTEVEPWVDINPTSSQNLIGVYQQDRISSGGANGQGTSYSIDGGDTWIQNPASWPEFGRCQGAAPGSIGDYERVTDPWVSFGPDGVAYQQALSFNDTRNLANAILVSRSFDGGQTWDAPKAQIVDTDPHVFNDKNSITADPHVAGYAYGVWDRLVFPTERAGGVSFLTTAAFRGPTYFSRTIDGGDSWQTKKIFDPGQNDQTIGNVIAVTGEGDLVNGMVVFRNDNGVGRQGGFVSVLRSANKGTSWSGEIPVARLGAVGVSDPRDGAPVRTGDIIPSIATDERAGHDEVYLVWQDARWTSFQRDQIAFAKSTDGGRTWSEPVRINAVESTQAFTPVIDVDDAGNIAVTYHDFRFDSAADTPLRTDVWVLRSSDGGQHWSEERVTPTSFDMRNAPVARGFFVGDYIGMANAGQTFTTLFVQAGATAPSADAFSATVAAPFPPATITPEPAPAGVAAAEFPTQRGKPTPR